MEETRHCHKMSYYTTTAPASISRPHRPQALAEKFTEEMTVQEICVTTRHAWKAQLRELEGHARAPSTAQSHDTHPPPSSPESMSGAPSPLTDASELPSPSRATSVSASSSSKRQRTSSLVDATLKAAHPWKIKKRASTSTDTSGSSSRGGSRQRSVALDEPIYRSDRSRSTSEFPPPVDVEAMEWWAEEDGSPGGDFVSAADVVRRLAKTYKSCKSDLAFGGCG
ncbi:hypothetical protein PAXRUDRAFT_273434 [Paxillus rubicundulus Ve08.2h10]|uniref:Uncharacterized protein n=1 Tax=Paxillus rubicundulus Ve08.2h10 TaxID=930991 RepID=A0A0D0EAV2_9AGAM|nr:hypothetical protein PAXRUDRAFT_273434 [Paxillus rubicundulus Ve08.2h10]